jgi:hypothetical protein
VDPLTCLKTCPELDSGCQGKMKIISFIENEGLSGGLLQEFKTAPGGPDGSISAIDLVFSDYIECFDLIFIYLPG